VKYRPINVGRSGYTSLSIEEKAYARLRRNFDTKIDTDKTFTAWALDILETAISRENRLDDMFPTMKFVGKKSNGIIIQDRSEIIEIDVSKTQITCKTDKNLCRHVLFAALHPSFEP